MLSSDLNTFFFQKPRGIFALKEVNIHKTVKHGGCNIMVWGCFTWSGISNLAQIEGIMTAEGYIDNSEESLLKLDLENNFIFQQDNDPHTAKKSNKVKLLEWPPQSPDLNPITNRWAYLDGNVDKTNVANKTSYYAALQKTWEEIYPEYLKKLAESMSCRLEAVLKAKGDQNKY